MYYLAPPSSPPFPKKRKKRKKDKGLVLDSLKKMKLFQWKRWRWSRINPQKMLWMPVPFCRLNESIFNHLTAASLCHWRRIRSLVIKIKWFPPSSLEICLLNYFFFWTTFIGLFLDLNVPYYIKTIISWQNYSYDKTSK